jgi:hypothetical protein
VAAGAHQGTTGIQTQGINGLVTASRAAQADTIGLTTCSPTRDYSNQVIALGRLMAGKARESRRVVHAFVLTPDLRHDTALTARCGETLPIEDMQWLPGLTGMPCERCVLLSLAAG